MDNCGNSRANTCIQGRLCRRVVFIRSKTNPGSCACLKFSNFFKVSVCSGCSATLLHLRYDWCIGIRRMEWKQIAWNLKPINFPGFRLVQRHWHETSWRIRILFWVCKVECRQDLANLPKYNLGFTQSCTNFRATSAQRHPNIPGDMRWMLRM